MNLIHAVLGPARWSFPSDRQRRLFSVVAASALLLLAAGCSGGKNAKGEGGRAKRPPVPVTVAVSIKKDMPVEIRAIGTVEPFVSVGIKSQVEGILEKANFREGDPVKAGELLFTIDPRSFSARVRQAEATLAKDRAALDNARRQAKRYGPAARKGYVSAEQSDQAQTTAASLAAQVQADQAALESARLDLDHCTIRSPISGITGDLLTDPGNLVKADADQPLVTINQVVPIKVSFTAPEQDLPEIKKYLAAGTLTVQAAPNGNAGQPQTGKLSFLDNTVDPTTGTIQLKAIFANRKRALWPGQFVNVRLFLTTRRGATVVPSQAVQTGQHGTFVYVVQKDRTVALQPVTVAFDVGREAVIAKGLAPGETVVTDGQMRLVPGAAIKEVTLKAGPAEAKR